MKVPNIKIEKREGSKNWRIRYRHDGKDIRKTVGTKREAELAANAIRKQFIEEKFDFKEKEQLSFKELYTRSVSSSN